MGVCHYICLLFCHFLDVCSTPSIFYFGFLVLANSMYSCCLWPSDRLGTVVSSDGLSCTLMPEISMDRANVFYRGNFAPSCCYLTLQLLLLFEMMPWYSLVSHVSG